MLGGSYIWQSSKEGTDGLVALLSFLLLWFCLAGQRG